MSIGLKINVKQHGDSRQKKIIMQIRNNVNENQRNISSFDALQDFNVFETLAIL